MILATNLQRRDTVWLGRRRHGVSSVEFGAVDPHTEQGHGEPPGQCHFGFLGADAPTECLVP